ncbi:MAG: hypothetical protein ABIO67_08275 [Mycobacteriales bacterium]
MPEPITRDDLAVTLAVRNDLTPAHDDAVIGEFLARVGDQIDARVDERVAAVAKPSGKGDPDALPIVSLVMGIPITAIVMGTTDGVSSLLGLAIVWTGIAVVNFAHGRQR